MHLKFVASRFNELTPIARRMYATGLTNDLYQLVTQLTDVDEQMKTSLGLEDAFLNISPTNGRGVDFKKLLDETLYGEDASNDANINKLIDVFPLDKKDYSFTSENAEKFKTGLRYLCSDANISPRDIVYALDCCINQLYTLLYSISEKKKRIKENQYEAFWYDFLSAYAIGIGATKDYEEWKEEHDYQDFLVLKDKRDQEILKMLKSGVFNHDTAPVIREITGCKIIISEDALEEGTEIPENIAKECARFSKYVEFKEDIYCLDYKKLGKYIYKHFGALNPQQQDSLAYFANILSYIHKDMAECKPKLKKYINDEKEILEEAYMNALKILSVCEEKLKEEIPEDFLVEYLNKAFYYSNSKQAVQNGLMGQSKYTLLCKMLGMLKTTQKVFVIGTTSADLAKILTSVIQTPKEESLKRYIDEGASEQNSPLSRWTTQFVMERLGNNKERLFVRIAGE